MPIYRLQTTVDQTAIAIFGRKTSIAKAKDIIRLYLHRSIHEHYPEIEPPEPVWSEHPHIHQGIEIPGSFLVQGEISIPDHGSPV